LRRSGAALDILCALAVGTAAFFLAGFVVDSAGIRPMYYQHEFSPAVMWVCGRGYVAADYASSPRFRDFLTERRDSMTCASTDGVRAVRGAPLHDQMRYLQLLVAKFWRPDSISWSAVRPLFMWSYAVYGMLAYILLRMAAGRFLATFGALALITSPSQLANLPHLRDFMKAPFFIAVLILIGVAGRRQTSPRGFWLATALFGGVVGIGFGFRSDIIIAFPLFVLAVLLSGRSWEIKAAAPVLVAVVFAMTAWPILRTERASSAGFFVLNHGLMDPFDEMLGLSGPDYSRGHLYHDRYLRQLVEAYWTRVSGKTEPLPVGGPFTDRANRGYFLANVAMFPADVVARAYAATVKVLDLSFTARMERPKIAPPVFLTYDQLPVNHGTLRMMIRARERLATALEGWGLWLFLIAAILLSAVDVARAVLFSVVALYLAAYTALQFHIRHIFHLEIISLWVIVVVVSLTFRLRTSAHVRALLRPAAVIASLCLVALLALFPLRALQQRNITRFVAVLDASPSSVVAIRRSDSAERTSFSPVGALTDGYLVVEIDLAASARRGVETTLRFAADPAIGLDRSRTLYLERRTSARSEPLRVMLELTPEFRGIEIETADADCLKRVTRLPSKAPLAPWLMIRSTRQRFYQRFTEWPVNPLQSFVHAFLRQPRFRVQQAISTWIFLGYDGVDLSSRQSLKLYWMAPPGVRVRSNATLSHQGGRRWIQTVKDVRNLARPVEVAAEKAALLRREGNDVTLLPGQTQTFAGSPRTPVSAGKLYLSAVWARGESGSSYAGPVWLPQTLYSWFLFATAPSEWTHYAEIAQPPPGTTHAVAAVLNTDTVAAAGFRDLFFAEIGGRRLGHDDAPPLIVEDSHASETRWPLPRHVIDKRVGDWSLIGVDIDEQRLQADKEVPIVFHWRVPTAVIPPGMRRLAGERWTQTAIAKAVSGAPSPDRWYLHKNRGHDERVYGVTQGKSLLTVQAADVLTELPLPSALAVAAQPADPQYSLEAEVAGWRLFGYDLDERSVADGRAAVLSLYWKPPADVTPIESSELRPIGAGSWLQTVPDVRNLVPGGPQAFKGDIYEAPQTVRSGATLQNNAEIRRSSFISNPLPAIAGTLYLQSARYKTAGGAAYVGRQWGGRGEYAYVVAGATDRDWAHAAGAFRLPSNEDVRVWLLNFDATGAVTFADPIVVAAGAVTSSRCSRLCPSPVKARSVPGAPTFMTNQRIGDWTLVGYDTNIGALVRGMGAPVQLHWLAPDGARRKQTIAGVRSLVSDGGFSSDVAKKEFADDIYASSGARSIERMAILRNSSATRWSSFASKTYTVRPGVLYLHSAEMIVDEATGYIGRQWMPSTAYEYVVTGGTRRWQRYSGLAATPVDATGVRLWLLNADSDATVTFDNVIFAPLGLRHDGPGFPITPARPEALQ
jgi:hypothetical protein